MENTQSVQPNEEPKKIAYTTPTVTVYGTLAELTQAGDPTGGFDFFSSDFDVNNPS